MWQPSFAPKFSSGSREWRSSLDREGAWKVGPPGLTAKTVQLRTQRTAVALIYLVVKEERGKGCCTPLLRGWGGRGGGSACVTVRRSTRCRLKRQEVVVVHSQELGLPVYSFLFLCI